MGDTMSSEEFNKALKDGTLKIQGGSVISSNNEKFKQQTIFSDPNLLPKEKKPKKEHEKKYGEQLEEYNKDLIAYLREKVKINRAFYIPGNVPSLKNNKKIIQKNTKNSVCCNKEMVKLEVNKWICSECKQPAQRRTRPSIVMSDTCQNYINDTINLWASKKPIWEAMTHDTKYPVKLGVYYIRESNHDFDYNNGSQILQDIIVDKGWIEDDCARLMNMFALGYHVNPDKAGVIITVMNDMLWTFVKEL